MKEVRKHHPYDLFSLLLAARPSSVSIFSCWSCPGWSSCPFGGPVQVHMLMKSQKTSSLWSLFSLARLAAFFCFNLLLLILSRVLFLALAAGLSRFISIIRISPARREQHQIRRYLFFAPKGTVSQDITLVFYESTSHWDRCWFYILHIFHWWLLWLWIYSMWFETKQSLWKIRQRMSEFWNLQWSVISGPSHLLKTSRLAVTGTF